MYCVALHECIRAMTILDHVTNRRDEKQERSAEEAADQPQPGRQQCEAAEHRGKHRKRSPVHAGANEESHPKNRNQNEKDRVAVKSPSISTSSEKCPKTCRAEPSTAQCVSACA